MLFRIKIWIMQNTAYYSVVISFSRFRITQVSDSISARSSLVYTFMQYNRCYSLSYNTVTYLLFTMMILKIITIIITFATFSSICRR